jgi:hypothetical protein
LAALTKLGAASIAPDARADCWIHERRETEGRDCFTGVASWNGGKEGMKTEKPILVAFFPFQVDGIPAIREVLPSDGYMDSLETELAGVSG